MHASQKVYSFYYYKCALSVLLKQISTSTDKANKHYTEGVSFLFFLRYVKSYLVPDKANLGKRKTSVKKKTLSPTFNEILRVRIHKYISSSTKQTHTLFHSVMLKPA